MFLHLYLHCTCGCVVHACTHTWSCLHTHTHTHTHAQELNLMQSQKDQSQDLRRRHLSNSIELQYNQLKSLHEVRSEHLSRQHASEWDNQIAYSKKAEREMRKKHVLELKEHPKSMKVSGSYHISAQCA